MFIKRRPLVSAPGYADDPAILNDEIQAYMVEGKCRWVDECGSSLLETAGPTGYRSVPTSCHIACKESGPLLGPTLD